MGGVVVGAGDDGLAEGFVVGGGGVQWGRQQVVAAAEGLLVLTQAEQPVPAVRVEQGKQEFTIL